VLNSDLARDYKFYATPVWYLNPVHTIGVAPQK